MQSSGDALQLKASAELAAVETFAREVFVTREDAEGWLDRWHPSIGASPRQAAHTRAGAHKVQMILNAIKHGGPV